MFSDDELLPVSALQHFLFCPRQCALIHVECQWADNLATIEGNHLHEKAHKGSDENHGDMRIIRAMDVRSYKLGLIGKTDVVEFRYNGLANSRPCVVPIEYKRGKTKPNNCDRVQLCAQALCLEEMLNFPVEYGEIYYGKTRRRETVTLTQPLREETCNTILQLRTMLKSGATPRPIAGTKCEQCSMMGICLPNGTGENRSAKRYLGRNMSRELAAPTTDSDT